MLLIVTNAVSLLSVSLLSVVRSAGIVVQSIGANFISLLFFSVMSFAAHEYGNELLEMFDGAYGNFYVYVYRRIIESYGWLIRVYYEIAIPMSNFLTFITKKVLLKDMANTFATCGSGAGYGMSVFFQVLSSFMSAVGNIMNGIFRWLIQWSTEKLDVTTGLGELQEIPGLLMGIIPCTCSPLVRPLSSISRLLSTKTLVNLIDSAINIPVRLMQVVFYGSDPQGLVFFFEAANAFLEHAGIFLDDACEEIIGQVTKNGFVNVRRPFVFGLLSYLVTAAMEMGKLVLITMISTVSVNGTSTPALDLDPVFVNLNKFAESSGGPLETFVDFAYGFNPESQQDLVDPTYCPLFPYDSSFSVNTTSCKCKMLCGKFGQCYNKIMCVPYYDKFGLTLHGIPTKSYTPIIEKCNDNSFCLNGDCLPSKRCRCITGYNISWFDGKCYPRDSTDEGICNAQDCSVARSTHEFEGGCVSSDNAVDAPVGNPFSCTVSSALEAAVGGAYVASMFARELIFDPSMIGDMRKLVKKSNNYLGGISYRTDLSCAFRSRMGDTCDCASSPFCNHPTINHNVIWPLRKVAFYAGLGATEGISNVQDWMGAAITTTITMAIDGGQAVLFVALNLFDGFEGSAKSKFKNPFDLATTSSSATLCASNETKYLCDGTDGRCIAWWYDGRNNAIRSKFYEEQEHWCGSLVVEPVIMRGEQLITTMSNFLERVFTGSMRRNVCKQGVQYDTDTLTYINVLFDRNGNQLQTSEWNLFAPDNQQWCKTTWHRNKFACDVSGTMTKGTRLVSNVIRQLWRNMFAILFFHKPGALDIEVHQRVCDLYDVSNSIAGVTGNAVGTVGGSRVAYQVSHVMSIAYELAYGPLIAGSLFVSEEINNLVSVRNLGSFTAFLDNSVINTIILISRYVFVSAAKVMQMLQVVAFGTAREGLGGEFVESMYTIIRVFAEFFNRHGVEIMRVMLQVVSGFFQILQGKGIGEFIRALEQFFGYLTKIVGEIFSSFWPWFKNLLGPVGDLLDFVEGTLCNAISGIGKAIRTVKGMIQPAGGLFGRIFDNRVFKSIGNLVSPVLKPIAGAVGKLPFGSIGMKLALSRIGLKRIPIIAFMGNIDDTLDKLTNLDCSFDKSSDRHQRAHNAEPTQAPTPGPSSLLEHRRRRTSPGRRLLENTTDIGEHEMFMEMRSAFDWSGTTVCAKIGQVDTPPQNPYEIALWTSCVEYRIRAAAISTVIQVPSNIFDDWYSVAEWSARMIMGSLTWWTTNATLEDLTHMGYPAMAIMQVHKGASTFYNSLSDKFSLDEAIDQTFANTGTDTADLKNIVHNLPSVPIPDLHQGSQFVGQVVAGATQMAQTIITASEAATPGAPTPNPPRRRLMLFEETFKAQPIRIPRGNPIWDFSLTTQNCPLIMETLSEITSIGVATKDHYIDTLPTTITEFYKIMKSQRYDTDPLLNWKPREQNFMYPPRTMFSLVDKAKTGNTEDMDWKSISPSAAVNAIKDFVKIARVENTLDIPLLVKPAWEWVLQLTKTCDHVDALYTACQVPKATIKHTKRMLIRTAGLMTGAAYLMPSPVSSAMLLSSPMVFSYVFMHTRYGWTPFCAPMLPVCLAQDVQILLKDSISIDRCFCQTSIGQSLIEPSSVEDCKNCVFYGTENPKIKYKSCPERPMPALVWAPLRAMAWQFPRVFDFVFRSHYSPLRFLGTNEILSMKSDISALDEACVYMHAWDIALVVLMLPTIASLAVFAYGQVLFVSMQFALWIGTILCLLKPGGEVSRPPVAARRPTQGAKDVVLDVNRETKSITLRKRHQKS